VHVRNLKEDVLKKIKTAVGHKNLIAGSPKPHTIRLDYDLPILLSIRRIKKMKINDIREIGKDLIREIPAALQIPARKEAIGTGAAGDKTLGFDMLAEEIILEGLRKLNEPLTFISEEVGVVELHGGGRKVLVDPVDGSKNALAGLPFYCTSIAVADGETINSIRLAYVVNLSNGSGGWLNGRQIRPQTDDVIRLICYEAQVPGKDIPRIMPLLSRGARTRCMGATALDLAYLGAGASSVFVTPSLSRSFDFAGGWLLIREAGGIITDISGKEIDNVLLDLKRSSSLLAAGNRQLHNTALKLLSKGE
jgi:myo-inositol-1(or 4)-monophosphatase